MNLPRAVWVTRAEGKEWCLSWSSAAKELKKGIFFFSFFPASPEIHQLGMSWGSCVNGNKQGVQHTKSQTKRPCLLLCVSCCTGYSSFKIVFCLTEVTSLNTAMLASVILEGLGRGREYAASHYYMYFLIKIHPFNCCHCVVCSPCDL